MRVLTIWKTWSGPTARLLSDGLRRIAVPCGPLKPAPRPSKLATKVAGGRLPCDLCSTAAAPEGLVIIGGVGVGEGLCDGSTMLSSRSAARSRSGPDWSCETED